MPYPTRNPNPTLAFWGKLLRGKDEPEAPKLPSYSPEIEALLADIEYCGERAAKAALADDWAEAYSYRFDGRMLNDQLRKLLADIGVVSK